MITQVHRTYPLFEKNQVLTHSQLNQMVSYLEEQERLTRTGLIGIGIVCGLEVKPGTTGENSVRISEGLGITSEGDLLRLCDCTVTQYRSYKFGSYLDYAPFQDDETGEQDVKLWELLSEGFEDEESVEEIHPLEEMDLEGKVVMLFLEIHDRNLKSCLSKGCDEIGVERRLNIRKLLIDIDDLDRVLEKTGNQDITHFAKRYELEDYALKKARFEPPAGEYDTLEKIGDVYAGILFSEENNPVDTIFSHWQKAYDAFEPVLSSRYDKNPFAGADQKREEWESTFKEKVPDQLGIQYYYDFIKDLILAYREFREVSFDLLTECSPDSGLFPKHLILGEVTEECTPSSYRQQFIQTPVYSSQRHLLSKTRSLFDRAVAMMKKFDTVFARKPGDFELRITPSVEKGSRLSERSIPFYYPDIAENEVGKSLEELWDDNLARRCAAKGSVPAYENNRSDEGGEGGDNDLTPVTGPLHYDLDRYNFFRIEGCLGKSCREVMDELSRRIKRYNLPIALEAVRVNGDAAPLEVTGIDYSSGFHDLHEEYFTYRYQLSGFLRSGLYAWELYKRFEDVARKREKDFTPPLPDEMREILEEVYKHITEYFCRNLSPCIRDFIDRFEELKDGYASAMEFAIDRILEEMDPRRIADLAYKIEGENGKNLFQGFTSLVSRFLTQVVDAFFFHPLYRIYYAYRRREYYHRKHLENGYQTFSEYLEQHPGLNHMAGVPEGGTFVLVYGEVEGEPERVAADFALPYRWCCDGELSIPVCDDAEAREHIEVAPFARPDFAFTFRNRSVVIDLTGNDHELYDLENEFCKGDKKTLLNLAVKEVEPLDETEEADLDIVNNNRSVRYTPPKDFTGIFKFRYTLQKLSNGLTDTGVVTVLVRDYCIRIRDFTFQVHEGQEVSAVLPESFLERKYTFNDPVFDPKILAMENGGEELKIQIRARPEGPYSVDYTASSPEESLDGCGRITFVPGEEEKHRSLEIVTQPADTSAGHTVEGPPEVMVFDPAGTPQVEVPVHVKEDIFDAGTFTVHTNENGLAVFDDLVIKSVGEYRIVFFAENIETEVSSTRFKVYHLKLEDFHFSVRREKEIFHAMVSKEFRERGYQVSDTQHNEEIISVEVIDGGMQIQMKSMIETPYSFNYTASAQGEPEGNGTVTLVPLQDVTVFYGDLTNDEIRGVLQGRDISFTSRETKPDLIKKLAGSTSKQPLSAGELNTLSDHTVKKLGERLNIEVSETNRVTTINALTKVLQ